MPFVCVFVCLLLFLTFACGCEVSRSRVCALFIIIIVCCVGIIMMQEIELREVHFLVDSSSKSVFMGRQSRTFFQ